MTLDGAREAVTGIASSLEAAREDRERLIKGSRDVIALCSRSIVTVHGGDIDGASKLAEDARARLEGLREGAPDRLLGHIGVAEQELVEALALIAIVSGKDIPTPSSMSVSGQAYVLGLLDCIGELKRQVLDRIRAGDAAEAERMFDVMGGLYEILYPMGRIRQGPKGGAAQAGRKQGAHRARKACGDRGVGSCPPRAQARRRCRKCLVGAGDGIRTHELLRD